MSQTTRTQGDVTIIARGTATTDSGASGINGGTITLNSKDVIVTGDLTVTGTVNVAGTTVSVDGGTYQVIGECPVSSPTLNVHAP